jgi:glycosyltransferase involved in cell wall biosynthesis
MPTLAKGNYWQPVFKRFSESIPQSVVFTGIFEGFLKGFENSFRLERYNGGRMISFRGGRPFLWSSPAVMLPLLKFRPHVILTSGFHLCTAYVIALKLLMRWRLVLLWDGVGTEVGGMNRPALLHLRRFIGRHMDLCISNTHAGSTYLRDVLGIPGHKIVRHPYEVPDPVLLARDASPVSTLGHLRRPTFLYVGDLIPLKNLRVLLQACRNLLDQGLAEFSCVIVGSGYESDDLQQCASSLGLDRHVTFTGRVPYQQLSTYYSCSDVLVLPSTDDIWGMVVLEAMSFGKPVLCSSMAGASEMVHSGVNGYVFNPADPSELADRMAEFCRNPSLATQLGEHAARLIAPYTPEAAAEVLIACVRSAATNGRLPADLNRKTAAGGA